MLQEIWLIFIEKQDFLLNLLCEYLKIPLFAIIIAILIEGLGGILIRELKKRKPTLGTINFLYTISSILMLGFLISFYCTYDLCFVANGKKYVYWGNKC